MNRYSDAKFSLTFIESTQCDKTGDSFDVESHLIISSATSGSIVIGMVEKSATYENPDGAPVLSDTELFIKLTYTEAKTVVNAIEAAISYTKSQDA